MDLLHDLLFDYTLRTVALGTAALGLASGALGAFAVLRRQSLLGDAVSHAALPGIVLAFLLTGSKELIVLVAGAFASGWLGSVFVSQIRTRSRVPGDSALGIVLAVFFGFGLVLLTYVQGRPDAAQAGLDRFLFGQAATLVAGDVLVIVILGGVALAALLLFWKEFKLLSFDPEFGASLGFPIGRLDLALTTVLVLAIVIGLQAVGVVLMAALVVAPAAAARQWTDSLGTMVWLSALFGAVSGVLGALWSGGTAGLPTGPAIVLAATGIVTLSLLFAPRRGLVWTTWRRSRQRSRIRADTVLADLYALYRQHGSLDHGHSVAVLDAMSDGPGGAARVLPVLAEEGWARPLPDRSWAITGEGLRRAEDLLARLGRAENE
ncbi:MAG: metal ABC transporter permease [marine benthic group bacterium]|jgi:manganese/zinc/iron transport system permease protein|nr:metal ABC transporter permease [Gemmatimonadota bacterium]MCL7972543.1 metal ABC transporter permease [Candidatus Benthicola marisminoris]MCL7973376.1 metal ABC transporter permease [Gemmatimonadota bacterium]MCL7983367.1 metal ABC transporter permease [Gemmatimonadota bacterium]